MNIFSAISCYPLPHPPSFLFSSHTQYVDQSVWLALFAEFVSHIYQTTNAYWMILPSTVFQTFEGTYIKGKPAFSLWWLYGFVFSTDQCHRLRPLGEGQAHMQRGRNHEKGTGYPYSDTIRDISLKALFWIVETGTLFYNQIIINMAKKFFYLIARWCILWPVLCTQINFHK